MKSSLRHFVDFARSRPRRFIFYSIGLELIAWLALSDVIGQLIYFHIYRKTFRELPEFLPDPSLYIFFLFVALRRVSKRYRLNSRKILLTDTREPILYLRAFYEESAPKVTYHDKPGIDEALAKVLKNVGPLVALGKPSDKQLPLGAIRVYFDQDTWQENVKTLMSMSKLVVIQAGHSRGLEWEIATAIKCLQPQQLLFTFLSWQGLDNVSRHTKFSEFATQLKAISSIDLPNQFENAHFLYFDHKWNPHFAQLSRWKTYALSAPSFLRNLSVSSQQSTFHRLPRFIHITDIFRKTSVTVVRETLRPVLKSQDIRLPIFRTILNISFLISLLSLIIFYLVLLLLLLLTNFR